MMRVTAPVRSIVEPVAQVDDDGRLVCPGCGGYYLHHDEVVIVERAEDAPTGMAVTVTGCQVSVDHQAQVPAWLGRRHGLKVRFFCEECPTKFDLLIEQHKGNTFMTWLPAVKETRCA